MNSGCSSDCKIESGYSWEVASSNVYSTWATKCGDGIVAGSEEWDDNNNASNDGCSSGCIKELGYYWSPSSTTNYSVCTSQWGDKVKAFDEDCDTLSNTLNSGCSSDCKIESGYSWEVASSNVYSTWATKCGDGIVAGSEKWDDKNFKNGDGCSYICVIEDGYNCIISSSSLSHWSPICGDNLIKGNEQCDDGNKFNGDGWNSKWHVEHGFKCSPPDQSLTSQCNPVWGDGYRIKNEACDDGDGCSSIWTVELDYTCIGGSSYSQDTWIIVWGDSMSYSKDPSVWDDGNIIPGDGWSSYWEIETGYYCVRSSFLTADVWNEIWGDGIRIKSYQNYCDDDNNINGDGWSSKCEIEKGYTCSGGTPTHRDIWIEICGDGINFGNYECDDGNIFDGDGWSHICEFENCIACSGGTSSKPDKWYNFTISAKIGEVSTSNVASIKFSSPMNISSISQNDLLVDISGSYPIDSKWDAKYQSTKELQLKMNVKTVLQGGEILTIKMINNKVFRGPNGGYHFYFCITDV